jgi:polyhydroxybutyrate depolymerase
MKSCQPVFLALLAAALLTSLPACGQAVPAPTNTPEPSVTPTAMPSDTPTAAASLAPADTQRSLSVNGLERSYNLYIPAGLDSSRPAPLVFVFHGYSMDAASMVTITGLNSIADVSKFILVYPTGTGAAGQLSWNAGTCCGYASENSVDETAFVRQIITDVGTIARVDPQRIYASGFSNGAFMAYRLACEMPDTFAAIAPVSGGLKFYPCMPGNKISVIHFHGLNDNVVPYADGVEAGLAIFTQVDGCTGSTQSELNPVVTHTIDTSCQDDTAVELYTVKTLGHTWPSQYVLPVSQIIWDFFQAHPKP